MQIKVFSCPVHGIEINVHCWRAYQEKYKDRWSIYDLSFNRIMTYKEFQEIINKDRLPGS